MEGTCGADWEQSDEMGRQTGSDRKSLARGLQLLVGTREPEILFREVTGLDLGARQITLATPLEAGQGGMVEVGGQVGCGGAQGLRARPGGQPQLCLLSAV